MFLKIIVALIIINNKIEYYVKTLFEESEGQNLLKKVYLIVLLKIPWTIICKEKNLELILHLWEYLSDKLPKNSPENWQG